MTIRNVKINNRMKSVQIETARGMFNLPFAKLRLKPTIDNKIQSVYVDSELGNEAVTYRLESGEEDSLHIDAFLDYNKDPDYMKEMTLYKLTLKAIDLINESTLSKREVARKLKTSPAQLYRLLDTANYSKTIDQMVKLVTILGHKIEFKVEDGPIASTSPETQSVPSFPAKRELLDQSEPLSSDEGTRNSSMQKREMLTDFPVIVEKYGADQLSRYIKKALERQPLMAA